MAIPYFSWLCGFIYQNRGERSWYILLRTLAETPFKALIANDMNRCTDGFALREEYIQDVPDGKLGKFEDAPCSVLEMMIALARRMDYELSEPNVRDRTAVYFWRMVKNLGLYDYDDAYYGSILDAGEKVRMILNIFLNREYGYSGEGGLFPLAAPDRDQRDVEIWYQMNAYLQENYPY